MSMSPDPLAVPAPAPRVPAPACLLYTMLRHGRGLSHEEAQRRIQETLGRLPAQAC